LRDVAVSVVIPALNEAHNLPHVLPRIPRDVHEIILVDGASTDGTIEIALALMPEIRIVHQESSGKGAALRAGFAAATGDVIVHLDADGSTDPAEIPAFVGALVAGADYAKGTRFIQGATTTDITFLRRLGNWGFVKLANLLFGTSFSDITYGYNAVWRHHSDKLALEIDGWANEIVGNIRVTRYGLRVVEVASREYPRIGGHPKLGTFSAGWAILRAIVAERFRPLPLEMPAPVVLRTLEIENLATHSTVGPQAVQLQLLPALPENPVAQPSLAPIMEAPRNIPEGSARYVGFGDASPTDASFVEQIQALVAIPIVSDDPELAEQAAVAGVSAGS
jgi:hypothetical protein